MLPLHHAPVSVTNGIIAPLTRDVKQKYSILQKKLTRSPRGGMIHYMKVDIVIVNIEGNLGLLSAPERFSSPERLIRCGRISNAERRLQGYAAELALSLALSGEALLPPEYSYDGRGKPVIEGGFVSLSHSGRFAVCALSPVPVGIDIEAERDVDPKLAPRILSPMELEEYRAAPSGRYLLERFVIKEAYLKLTGEGVFGGMSELHVHGGLIFRRGVRVGFVSGIPVRGCACFAVTEKPCGMEIIHM